MDETRAVALRLPAELYEALHALARRLGLAPEWLAAALVADALEAAA